MIRLKNDYCIDTDAYCFKLCESSIKRDPETNEDVAALKPIGYFSSLSEALKAYKNQVLRTEIGKKDYTLHGIVDLLNRLDEEIRRYD